MAEATIELLFRISILCVTFLALDLVSGIDNQQIEAVCQEENKGEKEMPKIFSNTCALCGKELVLPAKDSLNWVKCKSLHRDFFVWESQWKPVCETCSQGMLNKIFNEEEGDVDGS